jgi:hypothetical protein
VQVWLDDLRPAPAGWIWVRTPTEVIRLLETGEVSRLSLDFDLGLTPEGEEMTGYSVVRWLELTVGEGRWTSPLPEITIHSANPVGRARIQRAIDSIMRLTGS